MFVAAMRDEKMDMRFRLEAANWLVERSYGKPAMQVAAQSENDGSEQKEFRTVEEIRLFLLERGIDVARLPSPFAVNRHHEHRAGGDGTGKPHAPGQPQLAAINGTFQNRDGVFPQA
jgi:hypothetical protein